MRKQLIAYLILLVIGAQMMAHFGYTKAQASVIPKDAIRLRILANSDSEADQALKRKVRDRVKEQIDTWVADLHSVDDARTIIQSRIPQLKQTVAKVLQEEHSNQQYKVEFGKNIAFPTKVYGNFVYPAGDYEAVLVTLGKGEGANWWCVLFPPLCFLDFGTGTAIQKEAAKAAEQPDSKQDVTTASLKVEDKGNGNQDGQVVQTKSVDKPASIHSKQVHTTVKEQRVHKEEQLVPNDEKAQVDNTAQPPSIKVEDAPEKKVEVKFFIVDAIHSLFSK
ncbi:stage II sporulation protein R [Ectobacillus polymachus]|uniref:stage II sporulation protein R n=1 Tax=Ectobacillus polymachus TaxID=1508806 RepID=UPI003A89139A